jgi:hypothetical protein
VRAVLPCLALLLAIALLPSAPRARQAQVTMFEAPTELLSDDAGMRARTRAEIKDLGVHWLRVVLYWHGVAPAADDPAVPRFDESDPDAYPGFARYDRLLTEARARGMRVLLTVSGPVPRWATRVRDTTVTRPSATRFGRFMRAVIRRFGDDVDHWSIWNEPNHPDFLRPQYAGSGSRRRAVSPGIYRRLVWEADRAFRVVGEDGDRMLVGETAPRGTGKVVGPLTFLRGALCLRSDYRKRRGCRELPADGWAHHAYTTAVGPFFEPPSRNDVTIGVLGRLNSALARAGRADAVRRGLGIYLTEFGVESAPDPLRGVSFTRQAEYRAISERIAYRNGRVRAFSQYLMRDDREREGADRFGGFQTGLRAAGGGEKLSFEGFRLPVVADRGRTRTTLWGLVRPATGRTSVSIDYRNRGSDRWRLLKRDRTNSRGYWTTTTRLVRNRRYRVRWPAPDGARFAGPLTRSYRGR